MVIEYGDDKADKSIEVDRLFLVWVCTILLFDLIVKFSDEKVGNFID